MTPGNLPSINGQQPELCFLTLAEDVELVKPYLSTQTVKSAFGERIHILPLGINRSSEISQTPEFNSVVTTNLLCRAVDFCIKKDKSFFMAVPDLIYSDHTVQACYNLHRLTGKVVSIFNGRVQLPPDHRPLQEHQFQQILGLPFGVRNCFFTNMNEEWRQWMTTDPNVVPGYEMGHTIFSTDRFVHVFFRNPNPTVGKFTKDDLFYFATGQSMVSWDRPWQDILFKSGRVFIQTNLDICMSIEADDRSATQMSPNWASSNLPKEDIALKLIEKFTGNDVEVRRRHKFSDRYGHFCFTSQYGGPFPGQPLNTSY